MSLLIGQYTLVKICRLYHHNHRLRRTTLIFRTKTENMLHVFIRNTLTEFYDISMKHTSIQICLASVKYIGMPYHINKSTTRDTHHLDRGATHRSMIAWGCPRPPPCSPNYVMHPITRRLTLPDKATQWVILAGIRSLYENWWYSFVIMSCNKVKLYSNTAYDKVHYSVISL